MDKINKTILEGKLFVYVENIEEDGEKDVSVCAEINGINLWDWLQNNNKNIVKITLEKIE